ncbi:MAG TPA: FG-GAP-like repeat-containing protein [Limnochordales bacterium]|nr:FG-GAP-like repeat-containing protein [Limnochordales bacterium]
MAANWWRMETRGWAWVAAAAVWLLAVVAGPAAADALVHEQDLPFGPAAAAALVDVMGDGQPALVLAADRGVGVYAWPAGGDDGQGWQPLALLPPLPAPPTAVGVGDVTGDGVPELAVGTGNAGAVYVLAWTGRRWTLLGQTPYLWSPVRALRVGDVDGNGRAELVVLSEAGQLVVFGWRDRVWHTLWRSPPAWNSVLHVELADLTGDGHPHVILADQSGAVAVWRWPFLEPVSQGFVWGTPISMALTGLDGGQPQVMVTTNERLLYRYVWREEQLIPTGTPIHDARLPFDLMQPVPWPGEPGTIVAGQYAGGLGLWRITGAGLELLAVGRPQHPRWILAAGKERLLVGEQGMPASLWARRPADFLELRVNGRPQPLQEPPLVSGDHVLIAMRDWAALLGLTLYWDAERQRLTAVGRGGFAILTVGDPRLWSGQGIFSLPVAPMLRAGRTYAPPDLARAFGAAVAWDPRRRQLILELAR